MAQVWVAIEDRAPTGTDPIVGIYTSVKSAIAAVRKIVGEEGPVTKHGTEIELGPAGDRYYVSRYYVKR